MTIKLNLTWLDLIGAYTWRRCSWSAGVLNGVILSGGLERGVGGFGMKERMKRSCRETVSLVQHSRYMIWLTFYVERVTAHHIKIIDHSCFHNRWPTSKTKLKWKHLWDQGGTMVFWGALHSLRILLIWRIGSDIIASTGVNSNLGLKWKQTVEKENTCIYKILDSGSS